MIDFNINGSSPVITDEVELIFQQMDLLYDTYNRDVLGDEYFGTQYDEFLYDTRISAESLKDKVLSDLMGINLQGWIPSVDVSLFQGTEQDIALINITLTQDTESYTRIYKITS